MNGGEMIGRIASVRKNWRPGMRSRSTAYAMRNPIVVASVATIMPSMMLLRIARKYREWAKTDR